MVRVAQGFGGFFRGRIGRDGAVGELILPEWAASLGIETGTRSQDELLDLQVLREFEQVEGPVDVGLLVGPRMTETF